MTQFFPDAFRTVAAFAVVLGALVFFHELGHYAAARWRGVFVETFSIGFGRAIASWMDRRGTQWRVSWLPLGGYVKMHGQEQPEDVSDEVRASWRSDETFHGKPVLSRAIIVAAGPIANFVLAMVLFAVVFATSGRPITTPVVGEVLPDGAAARAGLLAKDRFQTIDGQPIETFEDIQRIVSSHPGQRLNVVVSRDGRTVDIAVVTEAREVGGQTIGRLGIRGSAVEYRTLSLPAAIAGGVEQTWTTTVDTVAGLKEIIAGQRGTDELGGPLRIAQLSGQVAQSGASNLLMLIAVLSVNLGLINLLPVPVLDGGHLLFYLVEAVCGRPLPRRAQEYGFRAGIAVLAGLFVFATWNDLSHIGLFRWVAGLIG